MLAVVLEYLAFGLSLVCSWVYGNRTIWGPVLGIGTALAFIAFGLVAAIYAAAFANIIFLAVHIRNLRKFMTDDIQRRLRSQEETLKALTNAWDGFGVIGGVALAERFDLASSGLNRCATMCYERSRDAGWWVDRETGEDLEYDEWIEIKTGLMHSEVSEVLEADRRSWQGSPLMDDKLVHRTAIETELADVIIRACDYAGKYELDLEAGLGERAADVLYSMRPASSVPGYLNRMHRAICEIEKASISHRNEPIQELILHVLLFAHLFNYDVAGAYRDKIAYNAVRPDHKTENRTAAKRGKRY